LIATMRRLAATALAIGLVLAGPAHAADEPRYDAPPGFTRCTHAVAWHGFFKWASARHTTCRAASRFMHVYADRAGGDAMPRRAAGYRCRIHYWRNADGDIYASRHVCSRRGKTIRFYGMV
jgi:hypothetical protein